MFDSYKCIYSTILTHTAFQTHDVIVFFFKPWSGGINAAMHTLMQWIVKLLEFIKLMTFKDFGNIFAQEDIFYLQIALALWKNLIKSDWSHFYMIL